MRFIFIPIAIKSKRLNVNVYEKYSEFTFSVNRCLYRCLYISHKADGNWFFLLERSNTNHAVIRGRNFNAIDMISNSIFDRMIFEKKKNRMNRNAQLEWTKDDYMSIYELYQLQPDSIVHCWLKLLDTRLRHRALHLRCMWLLWARYARFTRICSYVCGGEWLWAWHCHEVG